MRDDDIWRIESHKQVQHYFDLVHNQTVSGSKETEMVNRRLRKGETEVSTGAESEPTAPVYDSNKASKRTAEMRRNMLPILPLLVLSASFGLLLRPANINTVPIEQLTPPRDMIRKRALEEKECAIWLAPSSLKGHPGFGIYTTRDIHKMESILAGQDGPSIPVIDYIGGVNKKLKGEWIKVWDNYCEFHSFSYMHHTIVL